MPISAHTKNTKRLNATGKPLPKVLEGGILNSNATVMPYLQEREGAPSFAPFAKGGLLRSNATTPPLFAFSEPLQ
jgi:hypothetical protein